MSYKEKIMHLPYNQYIERQSAAEICQQADAEIAELLDLIWRLYQDRVSETAGELDDTPTWREAERVGRKK